MSEVNDDIMLFHRFVSSVLHCYTASFLSYSISPFLHIYFLFNSLYFTEVIHTLCDGLTSYRAQASLPYPPTRMTSRNQPEDGCLVAGNVRRISSGWGRNPLSMKRALLRCLLPTQMTIHLHRLVTRENKFNISATQLWLSRLNC